MTLPNFLVIGCHKGASTSLRAYLGQHPDVFVAPAQPVPGAPGALEPSFFALEGQSRSRPQGAFPGACFTLGEYEALFDLVTSEKAIGEKSPVYLTSPQAPFRMKELIPDVRLIAVLRNPIERAFSHYLMEVRAGREDLPFDQALVAEHDKQRMKNGAVRHYARSSKYAKRVERYQSLFPPEQLRIYLYEDLLRDTRSVVKELYEHIGVDPSFEPDLKRHNAKPAERRNGTLRSTLSEFGRTRSKRQAPPATSTTIPPNTRSELLEYYRDDIVRLQPLIGRDLSRWLE